MRADLLQLAEYLSGKGAVRSPAFLIRAPLFIFFTLVTFAGNHDHSVVQVILVAIAGSVVEAGFLYVVRPFFGKLSRVSIWPVWSAYWVAGELSGVVLLVGLNVPFVQPGQGVSAWVILAFNGFLAVVWLTAANLASGLLAKDLQLLRELARDTELLERLKRDASFLLEEEISQLNATISEKVLDLLTGITKKLEVMSSNTSKAELLVNAEQVRELCESEVRSLSHSIAARKFETATQIVSLPKVLNPWGSSRAKAGDIKLRLKWVVAIGIFNALAIALQRGGWWTAIVSLLLIAFGTVAIQFLDRCRSKAIATKTVLATVVLIASEYLAMSLLAMFILWVLGCLIPEINRFVSAVYVTVPVVLVIIWLLVQLIQDSARRLRLYGQALFEKRALLESALSDIEHQTNRARRSLGKFLHGSIQGRLASVSMALTVAAKASSKELSDELLTQARTQLELSAFEVRQVLRGFDSADEISLDAEIQQLKDGWKNLVDLSFEVSQAAHAHLGIRPELADLVVEAMRECITNAVRHGQAKHVGILIGLDPNLYLKVRNDGSPIEKLTPGFGITSISQRADDLQVRYQDGWSEVSLSWVQRTARTQ